MFHFRFFRQTQNILFTVYVSSLLKLLMQLETKMKHNVCIITWWNENGPFQALSQMQRTEVVESLCWNVEMP